MTPQPTCEDCWLTTGFFPGSIQVELMLHTSTATSTSVVSQDLRKKLIKLKHMKHMNQKRH